MIAGRNGKQCRERWVNILDPCVKIGGWSDSEQTKIFELMKEHFTSWSGISKCLNGRTENSIKNYFYSTIRRIQSLDVFDYFMSMKEGKEFPAVESVEIFESNYQLNKLNLLGKIICKWLFQHIEAKKEHMALFEYLFKMVADEKKKPPPKVSKGTNSTDSNSVTQGGDERKNKTLAEMLDPSALSGVHPLLPAILYGGFKGLPPGLFPQFLQSNMPHSKCSVNAANEKNGEKDALKRCDMADISIPIPQTRDRHENTSNRLIADMSAEGVSPQTVMTHLITCLSQNLANSGQQLKNGNFRAHVELPDGSVNGFKSDNQAAMEASRMDSNPIGVGFHHRRFQSGFSPVSLHLESTSRQESAGFSHYFKQAISAMEDNDKKQTTDDEANPEKDQSVNLFMCCKCMMAKNQCNCNS